MTCRQPNLYARRGFPALSRFNQRRKLTLGMVRKTQADHMGTKLTIKQEAFCQAYIKTGNASEAYRRAYGAKNQKPETVNRNAFNLTQNTKILARLAELKAEHAKRHNLTVDDLLIELEEARQIALQGLLRHKHQQRLLERWAMQGCLDTTSRL